MLNRKLMVLAIILVSLLAVSAVSAADNATDDVVSIDSEIEDISSIEINETNVISVEENQVTLEENNDGTFTDLANEIAKAGNQLNLTKNYVYSTGDSKYAKGIVIDKEIAINGGGFVIDGNNNASAFNISSDNVILQDIKFSNCYVFNSVYSNGVHYSSSNSSCYGGAIYWNGNNGALFNCSFVNCHGFSYSQSSSSSADYGVISSYSHSYSYGGAVYWKGNNSSLSGCSFINCSSVSLSYSSSYSDIIAQYDVSVNAYSYSYSYGGAVYLYGDNANIFDCSFIDSLASSPAFINCTGFGQFNSDYDREGCSDGGAIYLNGDNAILENCIFINSRVVSSALNVRSSGGGGAVYWNGVNGNLHDCSFVNSFSCYDGGAVDWTGDDGILSDCIFVNSHAVQDGGAVMLSCADNHVLSDCIFVNSSCDWEGGAVWGGQGYLYNCSFVNSSAQDSSGAIFWDGYGEAYNCSFINSYAPSGGAAFLRDGSLHDCSFINSTAMSYGGAVYLRDGAHLYDCSFVNSSADKGGTVYWQLYYSSSGVLDNCSFVNSCAENDGGTIFWSVLEESDAVLANCSFSNTSSKGRGLAIYTQTVSEGSVATLYGCSFDGDYYNYEDYCSGSYKFEPILIVGDYNTDDGGKAVVFGSQQLTDNCTANICSLDDESLNVSFIFSSRENLSKEFIFNNLSLGSYKASLHYGGDDLYSDNTVVVIFYVLKNAKIDVAPTTYVNYNDGSKLAVTLTDGATGDAIAGEYLIFDVNGVETSKMTDSNGQATLSTLGWAPGTYTVAISYAGNSEYNPSAATSKVTVKAYTRISAPDISVRYNDASQFIATLTNNFTGKAISGASVVVSLDGVNYSLKTNSKGQVNVSTSDLAPGSYVASVSYKGNSKYIASSADASVIVNKLDASISAVHDKQAGELVATLTNAVSGKALNGANVVVRLDGVDYTLKTNSKGQVKVSTDDLAIGTYTATVSYKGNAKYNSVKTSVVVNTKYDTNISAVHDKQAGELVATLTNAVSGKALVTVNMLVSLNGAEYTLKTNSKGQIRLSTNDLAPGSYIASVSYNGNSKYNPSNATVVVNTKYDTSISVDYDIDAKQMVATLTNSEGKALTSAKVAVNLDGVNYSLKTNSKGQVKVSTVDLSPGTYSAAFSYNGNSKYNPSSEDVEILVKKSAVLSAPDVCVVYQDESGEFVATLTNDEGKALNSANVVVTLNGIEYALKTNSKGQVKVSTADLTPGTYTAAVSYKGNSKYNPARTTATVTVNKKGTEISAVYNAGAKEVVATLTNDEGKALNGANVVIRIGGVNYSLKTNSKGQAKLSTADLSLGTYNASVSYKGNSKYNPSSVTVKVVIQ